MRLLFASLITNSADVSIIVIMRRTHYLSVPEPSLCWIGNGTLSAQPLRLRPILFPALLSGTEDATVQTATLIFPLRPLHQHRSLLIACVGRRVRRRMGLFLMIESWTLNRKENYLDLSAENEYDIHCIKRAVNANLSVVIVVIYLPKQCFSKFR
jgi:hypothetical protein